MELKPCDGRRDVICIEANKVFDFCFQEHRVERLFPANIPLGVSVAVDCQIDTQNITCREVSPREPVDPKKHRFLVCLAISIPVTLRLRNEETGAVIATTNQTVVILKQAVLCVPTGTEVSCQVTGTCCCIADVAAQQINCVFNLCVVIKSRATVQVLVPTLGICMPKECKTSTTGCPPVVPIDVCDVSCDKK